MPRSVLLYVLVDPRDRQIRYAGITRTPLRTRLQEHLGEVRRRPRPTYRHHWIRALVRAGWEPLIVGVGESTEDSWREDERALIAGLRWIGCRLVNGDDGGAGYVHQPDGDVAARRAATIRERRLLPDGTLRPMYTPEGLARVSARARAQTISPEHRAALADLRRGKPLSAETRAKISAANRGRKQSPEHVARKAAARRAYYAARRVPKICADCDREISKRATRCLSCAVKHTRAEQRKAA